MDTLEMLYHQVRGFVYPSYRRMAAEENAFLSRIKTSSSIKQRFISEELHGDVKQSNINKHRM